MAVLELERTYVSPGLFAVGPGRFSVSGVRTMRLILSCDTVSKST